MKIAVELNIYDVDRILREHFARTMPGVEVEGYVVKSWNTPVYRIVDDTLMVYPVRHRIRRDHAALAWPPD